MAAEEERIQRIVRQIVSSEIDGATPNCTNVELSSSSMALPMNVGSFQNTAEELRSRFQMPRSRSLPANRGPRALIPEERRQSPIRQIASSFNPRQNYGGMMSQRRPGRRQGNRSIRTRFEIMYNHQFSRVQQRCNITSIAYLEESSENKKDKAVLQKLGLYVDAVRFSKSYDRR